MIKKNNKSLAGYSIQPKMEELVKELLYNQYLQVSESESQKMMQDLKMQKLALELQNEELKKTILQIVAAFRKYTELNDFESSAFFSLSRQGRIIEFNRNAFQLLGKDQFRARNSLFEIFLDEESKPVFHQFLHQVYSSGKIESCELILALNEAAPLFIHLSGILTDPLEEQCLIGVTNISGQKQWEENLHKNELRLLTLAQMIPDLGWLKESYEVMLSCNRELESLFAGKAKVLNNVFAARGTEILEKSEYDFVDQDLTNLLLRHFNNLVENVQANDPAKPQFLTMMR